LTFPVLFIQLLLLWHDNIFIEQNRCKNREMKYINNLEKII